MKQHFQSNETLEMCDVHISENGKMVVETKSYHSGELARLGTPEKVIRGRLKVEDGAFVFDPYAEASRKPTYSKKVIRGRLKVEDGAFVFDPYAEASRKPTYSKKVVVGSTTVAVTADNVKFSLVLSRNYTKEQLVAYIEMEMKEVLRRIGEDLYETIISGLPQPLQKEG